MQLTSRNTRSASSAELTATVERMATTGHADLAYLIMTGRSKLLVTDGTPPAAPAPPPAAPPAREQAAHVSACHPTSQEPTEPDYGRSIQHGGQELASEIARRAETLDGTQSDDSDDLASAIRRRAGWL